jgi:arsenate reductase-like glutaredoxin family protein
MRGLCLPHSYKDMEALAHELLGLHCKSLGVKEKLPSMSEDECLKLLATDGMLVKRPILAGDGFVLVGFKEAKWEGLKNGDFN